MKYTSGIACNAIPTVIGFSSWFRNHLVGGWRGHTETVSRTQVTLLYSEQKFAPFLPGVMALLESLLVWKPLQVIPKLARLKDHYL
jgi:hypothetical protein